MDGILRTKCVDPCFVALLFVLLVVVISSIVRVELFSAHDVFITYALCGVFY